MSKKRENEDFWKPIDSLPPDQEPLSKEEIKQLGDDEGYSSWAEVKKELSLERIAEKRRLLNELAEFAREYTK